MESLQAGGELDMGLSPRMSGMLTTPNPAHEAVEEEAHTQREQQAEGIETDTPTGAAGAKSAVSGVVSTDSASEVP